MSVPTSCSNTWSKYVAKWYKCLINELVKQIILYRRQNGFFFSVLRCLALVYVFDSVQAWYLTHDNFLARPYGAFSVIFLIRIAV